VNVSPRVEYVHRSANARAARIIWNADISFIGLNNSQTNVTQVALRVWLHLHPYAAAHARSQNAEKIIVSVFARVLNAARNVNVLDVEMINLINGITTLIITTQSQSRFMLELIYL